MIMSKSGLDMPEILSNIDLDSLTVDDLKQKFFEITSDLASIKRVTKDLNEYIGQFTEFQIDLNGACERHEMNRKTVQFYLDKAMLSALD